MRRRRFKGNGNHKFLSRRQNRIYSLIKLVLIPLLLVALGLGIYILFFSNLFIVSKIHIKTEKLDCVSADDLRKESKVRGQNLFLVNIVEAEKRLQDGFICIKSAELKRQPPDRIRLEVTSRHPAALLVLLKKENISTESAQASSSASLDFSKLDPKKSFLVDTDGIIYSQNTENINIPKIYLWDDNLELGKKVSAELIKNSSIIIEKLGSFGMLVNEAKLLSENTLIINSSPKIIIALKKDIISQLASLQLILEKAKIDEESLEIVDLRFDKPVVKFNPKKKEVNRL